MRLLVYLLAGLVILWIASTLAAFVKKKTGNTFFSAVVWAGSAYLLLELALVVLSRLGKGSS